MLNVLRPFIARLLTPVGEALARTPVTPNAITLTGTAGVVAGALWLGAPGPPAVPVAVAGRLALRQSRAAIAAADGLLALPRRAVLRGVRDVG